MKFRVIGSHSNGNFFDIEVTATSGLAAFGAAALLLKEADEDGDANFYAAIPVGAKYVLPGEGVVSLDTVLDPDQADVFGLAEDEQVDEAQRSMAEFKARNVWIEAQRTMFVAYFSKRNPQTSGLLTRHPENPHWYSYSWVNESWLAWLNCAGNFLEGTDGFSEMLPTKLAELMMHVLDRLADGASFNQVVEETGITSRISEVIAQGVSPAEVGRLILDFDAKQTQYMAFAIGADKVLSSVREMLCAFLPEEAVVVAMDDLQKVHDRIARMHPDRVIDFVAK